MGRPLSDGREREPSRECTATSFSEHALWLLFFYLRGGTPHSTLNWAEYMAANRLIDNEGVMFERFNNRIVGKHWRNPAGASS